MHMEEWNTSDNEIQELEKLLLPKDCHFADDAKEVIRCWESKDVSACAGSGKTTVLLAKLKLLADRMPLENGSGVCVLSHTNVAVDEIKNRLSNCADKLMGYPNYIDTIQSFIDRFITLPYVREKYGRTVRPVDDQIFAEHLLSEINSGKYNTLRGIINSRFHTPNSEFKDKVMLIKALSLDNSGNLLLKARTIAGKDTPSAQQFSMAKQRILTHDGLIRYKDTYSFAKEAIESLKTEYVDLFSSRFKYVFIDEFQDCDTEQREVLKLLFNPSRCIVMRIGDPDQAIYNFQMDGIEDWIPNDGYLSIESSCRYSQEIADILGDLRKDKSKIISTVGNGGYKPICIIFDNKSINKVISQFIVQLDNKGLNDPNGKYYAIGFVGKEDVAGLKIGSYFEKFDNKEKSRSDYRYWSIVDEICNALQCGQLYSAEQFVRKLICRILHYLDKKNKETGKEYTIKSLQERLKNKHNDAYGEYIIELSQIKNINREAVDSILQKMISDLFNAKGGEKKNIFEKLPQHFLEQPSDIEADIIEKNTFVDPLRERSIHICTIHSVKGQTHDATLYLETEKSRGSDIGRIMNYYGIGQKGTSSIYDYSRKLAYVGFSRPKKLLCVAIQGNTYEKFKKSMRIDNWEIIDIRNADE